VRIRKEMVDKVEQEKNENPFQVREAVAKRYTLRGFPYLPSTRRGETAPEHPLEEKGERYLRSREWLQVVQISLKGGKNLPVR